MTSERRLFFADRVCRTLLSVLVVIACCAGRPILSGAGGDARLAGESDYRGRRLVDVLRELRTRGLDVIFSSAVVADDLRVTIEPGASAPRAVLDEILPPLGLAAEDGPSGSVLILPADPAPGQIRGRMRAAATGEPIGGATLRLSGTTISATSELDGTFAMPEVPPGIYTLVAEAAGFADRAIDRVAVTGATDRELTIELGPRASFVTEVVVTPNRRSVVREEQSSVRGVTGEEAVLAPTIGGDVSRVVEQLPGVAAPDNSAAFHVRGGLTQDVSMVLDGLELYDPFHLQSFQSPFSVIDATLVDKIDFFGGGFTADLGDRHGGFVEISTLAPDEPTRAEVELGTLNSRASYRSLAENGSTAWMISARAWYPEVLWSTTELGEGEDLDPRFWDLYAKAGFTPGPRHRLTAHGLLAYDRLNYQETGEDINERVDATTRNGYAWLRLLSAWSPDLTGETVLSGGRIVRSREGIAGEDDPLTVQDDRQVDFFGLKHDSIWQISNSHVLKAGAEVRRLAAEYRYLNELADDPAETLPVRLDPSGTSFGVYLAYRARLHAQLAAEFGVRWDRQTYTDDEQLSPRFNAVWRPGERSELRVAVGRFSQSQRIHELQIEDGETEFRPAETSDQIELSYQRGLPAGLGLRVDAYDRELTDLRPRYENLFDPIDLFPETKQDRVRIAPDEARLRGIELLLKGKHDVPLFWWVGYTLSSADDIIDGDEVPRSWDQTQALRFLVGYRRIGRWSVALSGSVHTGWPTTPVNAEVTLEPDGSVTVEAVPGERNSERLATYARLDAKVRRAISVSRGRMWLTLEVINLTDRENPCCLDDVEFVPGPGGIETRRIFENWLGITPSFSISWEF